MNSNISPPTIDISSRNMYLTFFINAYIVFRFPAVNSLYSCDKFALNGTANTECIVEPDITYAALAVGAAVMIHISSEFTPGNLVIYLIIA